MNDLNESLEFSNSNSENKCIRFILSKSYKQKWEILDNFLSNCHCNNKLCLKCVDLTGWLAKTIFQGRFSGKEFCTFLWIVVDPVVVEPPNVSPKVYLLYGWPFLIPHTWEQYCQGQWQTYKDITDVGKYTGDYTIWKKFLS